MLVVMPRPSTDARSFWMKRPGAVSAVAPMSVPKPASYMVTWAPGSVPLSKDTREARYILYILLTRCSGRTPPSWPVPSEKTTIFFGISAISPTPMKPINRHLLIEQAVQDPERSKARLAVLPRHGVAHHQAGYEDSRDLWSSDR